MGQPVVAHVLLVAKGPVDKFRYSNSNALTQFERYEKLGRDVTTRIVNSEFQLYKGVDGRHATRGNFPGQRWWTAHRRTMAPKYIDFMTGFMRDDNDVIPPPSLTWYLRLQSLWLSGGVFVDASLFFARPLPARARGFDVGGGDCGPDTDYYHANAPPPMVLQFPEPHDPAVACALANLDDCGRGDAAGSERTVPQA